MNVERILSAGRAPESPEHVQELLKNIITITNYLPGVRNTIGWRGVFRIPCDDECWTFKNSEFAGVFGIDYAGCGAENGVYSSSFNMFYFPDSEEDIIEKFPLNGAVYAYHESYRGLIRSFPDHPEFFNYFFIGRLVIGFNPSDRAISVGIESLSKDVIISGDGVTVDGPEGIRYLVEPGEAEQAIPSYELSSAVFNLMASSLFFHLEEKPAVRLRKYNAPGRILRGGILYEESGGGVTHNSLTAVFGCGNELCIKDFFAAGRTGDEVDEITWTADDADVPGEFSGFIFTNPGKVINTTSINSSLLGIEAKPPLYIISGFLGSGKTTFIKNFLEFQAQKYLFGAVIQNELGEAGLDGRLISDECRVVEMDEGCVCCSLSGNLRRGINMIIAEYTPDFIILETTGAANPMNLISEINDLGDIVRFDSVTTIIDAHNMIESLEKYSIAGDQVRAADILVLNKTDGLDSGGIDERKAILSSINRRALLYTSEYGNVNPGLIYDRVIGEKVSSPAMSFGVHNHKTHNDDGLSGITVDFSRSIPREDFLRKIDELPFDVFRIKGMLKFDGDEKYSVFQYVAGRHEISAHNDEKEPCNPFLVFIGRNMDNERIGEYFCS